MATSVCATQTNKQHIRADTTEKERDESRTAVGDNQ